MFSAKEALNRLIDSNELFFDEMVDLMRQIMRGELSASQIAAILMALRVKKETVTEISAAASVIREFSTQVQLANPENCVDVCGTGGDGLSTFNISTTAMFVAAAAGATIAKHGGRSVSSNSGSADVLEALGVAIELPVEAIKQSIETLGIGFMFAPNHHQAMRHVAPIRRELGVRTMFNILGPLTNPANAKNQLMGVFHPDLLGIQCHVLRTLGSERALIVYGEDGLDEISISGVTYFSELKHGEIRNGTLCPEEFGFSRAPISEIIANNAEESKAYVLSVLNNEASAARDIVVLNAGAIIYLSGKTESIYEGVELAKSVLNQGLAMKKLQALIQFTQHARTA